MGCGCNTLWMGLTGACDACIYEGMHTDTAPLRAYHNDPALRDSTIFAMRAHLAADRIVRSSGYLNAVGRGCAVGCMTQDARGGHSTYPTRWGIPEILAHLEDRIFEGLPIADAPQWPISFLESIALGADLSLVWPRFAIAILTDPEHGVARLTNAGSAQRKAIDSIADLYSRTIAGKTIQRETWQRARYAAYAATAAAADATAYAADAAATAYAADAAATAYAYAGSRSEHYRWMADTLLTILRETV
jgi:hypothetical protein